jgi:Domain of unknown function (DUF4145)
LDSSRDHLHSIRQTPALRRLAPRHAQTCTWLFHLTVRSQSSHERNGDRRPAPEGRPDYQTRAGQRRRVAKGRGHGFRAFIWASYRGTVTMNRDLWKERFDQLPAWLCPHCFTGTVRLIHDGLTRREEARTNWSIREGDGTLDDSYGWFTAILECTNSECENYLVALGEFHALRVRHNCQDLNFNYELVPRSMLPAPHIIMIPKKTPETVVAHLRRSFALYWMDLGACVSAIRAALEAIADHLGQSRQTPEGKFIPLGTRIKNLEDSHRDLAGAMKSIKSWGNDGAHGNDVPRDPILDAYELLEIELVTLFNDTRARRIEILERLRAARGGNI